MKVSLDNFKGDFTVEFWLNSDDINNQTLVTKRNTYTNYGSFVLTFRNGVLNLLCTSNNSAWDISSDFKPLTSTLSTNTWYHFALARERKNWYSYLDGVKITEFSNSELIMPNSYPLLIGGELDGYKYHGYIDNLRISKKAIYTPTLYPNGFNVPDENFNVTAITPPTSE